MMSKNKKMQLVKSFAVWLLLVSFIFSPLSFIAAQPISGNSVPEYFSKIINRIFLIAALIGFAVLIWAGIIWLTSAGNPVAQSAAKQRVLYGVIGLGIVFSSYIILAAINPDLTFLRFTKATPQKLETPAALLPTKERAKTIIAYEIPLGKLMDGALLPDSGGYLRGGVPDSDAVYGASTITQPQLDEYKSFGDELDGKWKDLVKETNTKNIENIKQLTDEIQKLRGKLGGTYRLKESFSTKINDVRNAADRVIQPPPNTCNKEDRYCILYCGYSYSYYSSRCQVEELSKLSDLISIFESKENTEISVVKRDLETAVNDIKNILSVDLIGTTALDLSNLNEDYSSDTEDLVNQILDQAKKVAIVRCCSYGYESTLAEKLEALRVTAETFREGYLIRKDIWEVIKQSIALKTELDRYRTLQRENLKLEGSDYIYEGTVAETRLDRILAVDSRIRQISNNIRIVSLAMNTAAGVITALTAVCNCLFCGVGCGLCAGDPCLPVRPALIASQAVLAAGAATLPPLASKLQKEVNKAQEEREGLEKSVERWTEGLEKSEVLLKLCVGKRDSDQLNLLSLDNFVNYREELEGFGYNFRIIRPWPDIEIENDTYTFYCLKGPLVPGITESSYPLNSSPFGTQKVACQRETRVGGLINSIKNVVADKDQMIDQMQETIDSAQEIINTASGQSTQGAVSGVAGNLLQNSLSPQLKDAVPREIFKALSGEQLRGVFKDTVSSMPEKYAKDLTGHIFDNLPGGKVKDILSTGLDSMSEKELRGFVSNYFDSLTNEAKKQASQAILEAMTGAELKENLDATFATIEDAKLKQLWQETLIRLGKEGRGQFFESFIDKMSEDDLLELYENFYQNLAPEEIRPLLKDVLGNSPSLLSTEVLNDYEGQTLEEKIKNIPDSEVKNAAQKTGGLLHSQISLKRALQGVSEQNMEKAVNQLPSEALKRFTGMIFTGVPATEIKDVVFYDLLDFDPNFLSRIIDYVPDASIKDVVVNKFVNQAGGDDLRDILNAGSFALTADPRTVLNNLFLKHIPAGTNLLNAANAIADQTYDEFLGEVVDVFPELGGIKDMLDKISPFVKNVRDAVNSVLDVVSLTQEQMTGLIGDLIGDILNQLPETKLRELAEEIEKYLEKYLPANQINQIINEILKGLPHDVLAELLKYLPEEELTLADLIYYLPDYLLADVLNQISKYIPADQLRGYLNTIFDYFPMTVNEILDTIFDNIPIDDLKNISDAIFDNLPFGAAQELMEKIASFIPDELLADYIKNLVDLTKENLGGILDSLKKSFPELLNNLDVLSEVFGDILAGIFTDVPGLKENAKEMAKLPPEFNPIKAPCIAACPLGIPSPCGGPAPAGPYTDVLKRFAYILANNAAILLNHDKLTSATEETDYIINVKIKQEIYGSLNRAREDSAMCFARRTVFPPVEQQLYKAEDAARYGWVETYEDPFNLYCCGPVSE